jgi:hypothetical protein
MTLYTPQPLLPQQPELLRSIAPELRATLGRVWEELTRSINIQLGRVMHGNLADLPSGLSTKDQNTWFYAEDYFHTYLWNGSVWHFAPGDPGSGFILGFLDTPQGGLWQLCNGSTVAQAKDDGTTQNVTVPDYTTASYLKLGITVSAGPTAGSGATSGPSATMTHAATALNITAASNASPIQITTEAPHGLTTNDAVRIAGVSGNTAANGDWNITYVGVNTFTLQGSTGNGAYTSGGVVFSWSAHATHTHSLSSLELQRTQLKAYFRR